MNGNLEIQQESTDTITIYRTRPTTVAERYAHPESQMMVEIVTIKFGLEQPEIKVVRSLEARS